MEDGLAGASLSSVPFAHLPVSFFHSATVCCVDSRGLVPGFGRSVNTALVTMSRIYQVVFVRSGCAFVLGCVGGLIGLVAWTTWTAQHDYPRSPSSIVWAAVGGTFGFVLGTCIGNRRLTGRPGWLVAGLVTGMLLGALVGWECAHFEYAFARRQLLLAGLPAQFIDSPRGGFSVAGYESIGLQYGICLGVLAGTTAGWFWNHPPRLSLVANLFPVLTSCFVALGAIAMHTGFRDLSKEALEQGWQSWTDKQLQNAVTSCRTDWASNER